MQVAPQFFQVLGGKSEVVKLVRQDRTVEAPEPERERRLHDIEDSFKFAKEHQVEFHAVYSTCVQAIRSAGAYVVLHRGGRPREAVAAARQAPALVLLRGFRMALS